MKIKHLFGLAVIAAMTASCSSNEDLGTAGSGTGTNEAGVGYATFSINLPSTSGSTSGARGTRAAGDGTPTFNGGDANEYAVNDATLLVFKKDATGYKFKEAVELGSMEPWTKKDPANSGITTTAKMTAKLTNASVADGEYYALILLNNNKVEGDSKAKIKYPTTDQTFSSWSKDASNATADNYLKYDKGFFMANAPKYVADGEPETLVKIDKIYASKQEAENSTATTVYVERGLAKVSLASGSEAKNLTVNNVNYNTDDVTITGWTLDVTNKKTFPVHVTEGLSTDYPDIWNTSVAAGTAHNATIGRFFDSSLTEFNRVYWGKDPNYSTDYSKVSDCEGEFNIATTATANFKTGEEAKKPQYCLENTFDIGHMVQGQTTRVLFKAKYKPNGFGENETFYKMGNSFQLWNATKVEAQIKAKAQEVLKETNPDNVKVTLNAPTNNLTEAGVHLVAAANVTHVTTPAATAGATPGTTPLTDAQVDEINKKLGFKKGTTPGAVEVGLSTFQSGESYYIARVKHFSELTPWNAGDKTYDNSNIDWLGRYGVLRNNWYELTVNSVSGPGYPDVPEVKPTDPDDENEQYINVEVKILDWAKRSDTIDL